MHIVGLEGMPRRIYTYPAGLGWGPDNLAETIGSYITTVGIVVLLVNLVVELLPRAAGRARPVARRDARVDDPVAAARVQLRGHPEGLERVRELGLRGPGGGPAQARARESWCSSRGTSSR